MINKLFILLIGIAFVGCESNDLYPYEFIKTEIVTVIGGDYVYYVLYRTGLDNYQFCFYLKSEIKNRKLQSVSLNDATFINVKFDVKESNDTIFMIPNYTMLCREGVRKIEGKYLVVTNNK